MFTHVGGVEGQEADVWQCGCVISQSERASPTCGETEGDSLHLSALSVTSKGGYFVTESCTDLKTQPVSKKQGTASRLRCQNEVSE